MEVSNFMPYTYYTRMTSSAGRRPVDSTVYCLTVYRPTVLLSTVPLSH